MPFSSLRFGQFCDFRPNVCFFASRSKKFEILPFSSSSLIPSIFSIKSGVFLSFLLTSGQIGNFQGYSVFLHRVKKTELPFK
ncbi:hypothetical protein Hanom_Chr12g01159221 [Helianthus anomalus]